MSHCCPSDNMSEKKPWFKRFDWIFWISSFLVIGGFVYYNFFSSMVDAPQAITAFAMTVDEFIRLVWWGLLLGIFFVALLDFVPREMATKLIGPAGTKRGVLQAACAGVLFDLCSHGILLVGMKLYERGASLGQVMAFLIASPWNSISLTIILFALIGVGWTLLFIVLSLIIAIASGFLFDYLVDRGTLKKNPEQLDEPQIESFKELFATINWSFGALRSSLQTAFKESRMIIRWMFFGIVLIGLIRAFVDLSTFEALFAPTLAGLGLTLLVATLLEVCSEGLAPIASDILNRAGAPGNAFTFLMAGVATDYTEIMGIKEGTKSWKIALFLPLVTVPQILVLGHMMNAFGA